MEQDWSLDDDDDDDDDDGVPLFFPSFDMAMMGKDPHEKETQDMNGLSWGLLTWSLGLPRRADFSRPATLSRYDRPLCMMDGVRVSRLFFSFCR